MPKNKYGHHRITIDVELLDQSFYEAMAELYLMSPACGPSNLKHITLTEAERIEYAEYSSMADGLKVI